MTKPPLYRLARVDTSSTIVVLDPPALEPVNAGTDTNPRPSQTHTVTIRTRDGVPAFMECAGRRILKRDNGGKASGARTYQTFRLDATTVHDAWGVVAPPQWVRDMYDAWRSGNLVDGRS